MNETYGDKLQALRTLDRAKVHLTRQQYRTIKGQILAGQPSEAMKGLKKLMDRRNSNG